MGKLAIIDLTKLHVGTEGSTVPLIEQFLAINGIQPANVTTVRHNWTNISGSILSLGTSRIAEEMLLPARAICEQAARDYLATSTNELYILSFDAALLKIFIGRPGIRTLHLGMLGRAVQPVEELMANRPAARPPAAVAARPTMAPRPTGWRWDHVMTEREALERIESLFKALVAEGCSEVRMTDIRPLLSRQNEVFRGSGSTTGTTGMITYMVREYQRRGGQIDINDAPPYIDNPRIQIRRQPETSVLTSTPAEVIPTQAEVVLTHAQVISTPTRVVSTPAQVAGEVSEPPAEAAAERSPAGCVGFRATPRSKQFQNLLDSANSGPYARYRRHVLTDLQRIIETKPGQTLRDCIGQAVEETRARLDAAAAAGDTAFTQRDLQCAPWRSIRRFVATVVTKHGFALKADGESVAPDVRGQLTPVTALVPDFELEFDGALMCVLIREAKDVTDNDEVDVAGALYASRGDLAVEQVVEVLAFLLKRELLELDPATDRYRVRERTPRGTPTLRVASSQG